MHMDIKHINMGNFLIVATLAIVTFIFNGCGKCSYWRDDVPGGQFVFSDTLTLSNDTIALYDTLWLHTIKSDSLIRWDSVLVHYPNGQISIDLIIRPIDGQAIYEPNFKIHSGVYQSGMGGGSIILEYYENFYSFKLGIILNKPGKYLLGIPVGSGYQIDGCKTDVISIQPFLYTKQRNLYLLSKDQLNLYDTTTIAAFVVK